MEDFADADYKYLKIVWEDFGTQNLGKHHVIQ